MAGLEHKYNVKKVWDPNGDHDDCRYFVLDPQHDPVAAEALNFYAMNTENDELAEDIFNWLDT